MVLGPGPADAAPAGRPEARCGDCSRRLESHPVTARALLLFTKPAVPGRVKTRLIGPLSAAQAARLHRAFLDDLIDRFRRGPADLRVFWSLEPGEPVPREPAFGHRQVGDDLGDRLIHAIASAADAESVAVIGSDHPDLRAERVARAFEELDRGADVVFGPATDGGYYLVAVRPAELRAEMFRGIPWSTDAVLAVSVAHCEELGLAVAELEPGDDVDRPEDLTRLVERLAREPTLAPRTWTELERLGLTLQVRRVG